MGRNVAFYLPATTSIVNLWSSGGVSSPNIRSTLGVKTASGVDATGGTLTTVLSLTGQGYVPYLIAYSNSAVPTHTIRCQVTVDSVIVFDATTDSIASTTNRGVVVVDAMLSGVSNAIPTGVPIRFNSSFVVKIASSQAGTDYAAISYDYHLT